MYNVRRDGGGGEGGRRERGETEAATKIGNWWRRATTEDRKIDTNVEVTGALRSTRKDIKTGLGLSNLRPTQGRKRRTRRKYVPIIR